MATSKTDLWKAQLGGVAENTLRTYCKQSVEIAKSMGVDNIKERAIVGVMGTLRDNKCSTSESIVEHFVMEAMAGKDLPMDFVDAKD